jgi:hypothetical protein
MYFYAANERNPRKLEMGFDECTLSEYKSIKLISWIFLNVTGSLCLGKRKQYACSKELYSS